MIVYATDTSVHRCIALRYVSVALRAGQAAVADALSLTIFFPAAQMDSLNIYNLYFTKSKVAVARNTENIIYSKTSKQKEEKT